MKYIVRVYWRETGELVNEEIYEDYWEAYDEKSMIDVMYDTTLEEAE